MLGRDNISTFSVLTVNLASAIRLENEEKLADTSVVMWTHFFKAEMFMFVINAQVEIKLKGKLQQDKCPL